MKLCFALLLVMLTIALAAPLRAQTGPTGLDPAPQPPGLPAALQGFAADAPVFAPAQSSLRCDQLLQDPLVNDQSAWREFRRDRLFSGEVTRSAPQSLYLIANRDGDPSSGQDVDATGQGLVLPSNLAELYGSLSYFYAAGTPSAGDELRVQLYELSGSSLGPLIITARTLGAERVEGQWRELAWEVTDATAIGRLRTLGRAALVFTMASGGNPGSTRLWLDDLTAFSCTPGATVGGRVTRGGTPVADALVALVSSEGASSAVLASTRSGTDGSYNFFAVPPQPTGVSYRVWFLNRPRTLPRQGGLLGFWAGPVVPQLGVGGDQNTLDLEVADVEPQSPPSYGEVVATDAAPAVLRWGGRANPTPGERHQLCLYDPARADPSTGQPVQLCGPLIDPTREERAFSLAPGSFASAPGFGFAYGRSYRWYVVVYGGDPRSAATVPFGYSFGERAITLVSAATPELPSATPQPGDPVAGVAGADWTLLIYIAADNTIGDARRAPGLGRPSGQLAGLAELAAAYPNVNLVSYVDRYGPGGAELCAYPPGGPRDCRLRAEPNSADPQTLASFVATGRSRYPATRTALLIVAPGQAAGRLALDETSPGAPDMSLVELEAAYQAAGLGPQAQLDLVIYQVPLLGSVEALLATAPYARSMVASPDLVWQLGAYRELVPLLAGPDGGNLATVARGVVTAYGARLGAVAGPRASTWAAYDLSRAGALRQALDVLAEAMQAALSSEATTTRPAVAAARLAAQHYDSSGNGRLDGLELAGGGAVTIASPEDALLDLRSLAGELRVAAGAPGYVQQAAANLVALLDGAATPVIASAARSGQSVAGVSIDLSRGRGLGIFFPSGDRLGGQPALAESYLYETASDPPGDSIWSDMLRIYLAGSLGNGPGGVTQGAAGGAQFRPLPGGFVSTTIYLPVAAR